ncbi:MlaC/ttg2D family ABC transporter substrate-binding protein [Coraliomargarita parva]|uniref:MlaC/ttg2D family ABC transporter substrate-binding protein n=1 Tax=Coraliomargarita parva TaxID=3014050 RepID=UPI0022B2AF6E|nr:ABC transporter substrate-binding protein [Coraliomargarita parva]
MKPLYYLVLLCVGSLLPVASLRADDPGVKLKETVSAVLDVLYAPDTVDLSLSEKEEKVREVIDASYDFEVIIRRAIGRNWNLMNETEQVRVMALIKELILRAYVEGLGDKTAPEITFSPTVMVTDKRAEVPTIAKVGDTEVKILYRLGYLKSGWQLYDIVAEDISVVSNYRQQFDDHFRKGDGQSLIAKLEELLNKEDLDNDIKI